MFIHTKKGLLLVVGMLVLVALIALPVPLRAEETGSNPPGMASFTDSNSSHVYTAGDSIGFKIGPFPCQAGLEDHLVFGIMERSGGDFIISTPPLTGLTAGSQGYYLACTADAGGYFTVAGQIGSVQQNGVLAVKIYNQDGTLLVNEQTGAEAFIPIVAADGTPAIVLGSVQNQAPTDPTLTASLVRATDDDLDHVYFDGQAVQLSYTVPGGMSLPASLQSMITVVSGVFNSSQSFITSPSPLSNATVQVNGSNIIISATINNPGNSSLLPGALGTQLSGIPSYIPGASGLNTPMPAVSADGQACIVGVAIPAEMLVTASPALSEIKNLYNTEQSLTFVKGGLGSITFSPGLNIIDNRDELDALDQGIRVEFDQQDQSFAFQVATSSLSFLQGKTAGLKAYWVMSKLQLPSDFNQEQVGRYINMQVVDNSGQAVADEDVGNYIDQENVVYNSADDTLLIPVKHFTTYSIGKTAPPDESAFLAWTGGIHQKTAAWEPTITFNQAVDDTSLDGITVWKRSTTGALQAVTVSPQLQSGNSKVVLVKHSTAFASGDYLLLIDGTVKTAAAGGQTLRQPRKYEFRI